MKQKIKKNKLKIFIALSLMITCLFSVMFATNTFAYESVNTISDTLTLYETDYSISTCLNRSTYLQDGYIDVRVNNDSGYITYVPFIINDTSYTTEFYSNYCVVINYIRIKQDGVQEQNSSTSYNNGLYPNIAQSAGITWSSVYYNFITKNNIKYKTSVINLGQTQTFNTSVDYNGHKAITLGFRGASFQSSDATWQGIRIYNIDFIKYDELYTSKYINDIETQYSQLLEDYNNLEDNYDTLNDNYTQLENDYNTLETNYNTLLNDYNDLTNTDTNGLWAYFSGFSIGYIDSNNTWQTLEAYQTFEDFKNSQYNYLNGISINLSNLKTRYPNYNKFSFAVQANTNGTPLLLNALSYKINNDGNKCQNGIVLESYANTIQLDYTNLIQMQFKVNYQNINDNISYYDENKRVSILLFNFEYDNSNNFEIISLNNEYNNGYSVGFQKGRESLNYHINALNEKINKLVSEVNTQQQTINALNEQINSFNSDYNLNNLMWTIGSTPFESFKQIWNVNFFGVNLADFFLGFITFFIALFIVKKFFL